MSNGDKLILIGLGLILGIITLLLAFGSPGVSTKSLGSVVQASEYQGTSTDSTWNSAPNKNITAVTLGSVVITAATGNAGFELRDATSTTDIASTTIATFLPGAVGGTYTFDKNLFRGLGIRMTSGNIATTTITYR